MKKLTWLLILIGLILLLLTSCTDTLLYDVERTTENIHYKAVKTHDIETTYNITPIITYTKDTIYNVNMDLTPITLTSYINQEEHIQNITFRIIK